MLMYQIVRDNNIEKEYPYRLQAIVHCFEKGYVYYGGGKYMLTNCVKIQKGEK